MADYIHPDYKAVIGLEIHAQLMTRSKIFCPDPAVYGADPNTMVSPISLGHPGTLPAVNKTCISHAIKMGLATDCDITRHNRFARKNYFYADLPKGYQISQDLTPICTDGKIEITLDEDSSKVIRIHRIHMEEDSGKSLHDQDLYNSMIDLNRAGTGLIEIVSEADMQNAEEAAAYVTEVRKLVRYLEICDGNMEEGSLRVDANVSVMKKEATKWGTKVEVKNINSISNIARAIRYEIQRQVEEIENGGTIRQQTRTWDAVKNQTLVMREKESSDDYRYFPEPDLLPLEVTEEMLNEIRSLLPELPRQIYLRYTKELGLLHDDAMAILDQKGLTTYFDALLNGLDTKTATTWMLGPVKTWINERALDIGRFPLPAEQIMALAKLVAGKQVSFSVAKGQLFEALTENPEKKPVELAKELDLIMETNTDEVSEFVQGLIDQFPDKVAAYQGGQKGLLGFFVGQVMRNSKGKADPKEVNRIVREKLEA